MPLSDSLDDLDARILDHASDFFTFMKGKRGPYLSEFSEYLETSKGTLRYRIDRLIEHRLLVKHDAPTPTYTCTPEGARFAAIWRRSST